MTLTYNPFDPEHVDDHDRLTAELRREQPVSEFMPGGYFVSRYADVLQVLHDPRTFPQAGIQPLDDDERSGDQRSLFETDPPAHTTVRRSFVGALSAKRIAACEPMIAAICAELVETFADRGAADLVAELGVPLPALVVGRLAGFTDTEARRIRLYCDDFVGGAAAPGSTAGAEALARCADFEDQLRQRIADRRNSRSRPDDLLTALVECRDENGVYLSDERVLTHLSKDVFIGGLETTTHLIGNLFFQILTTAGLYERLRKDRTLIVDAVEESLRHTSPVQVALRRVANDATVGGTLIAHGSVLVLGLASANRDESEFERADVYDVDRGEALRRHLAFDRGIHSCVGAALVRMEARAALDSALDQIPSMRLSPDVTYQRVKHFMMRGPVALDVSISTAAAGRESSTAAS